MSQSIKRAVAMMMNEIANQSIMLRANDNYFVNDNSENRLLNRGEYNSILSLIAYRSYQIGQRETMVRRLIELEFGVADIAQLKAKDFDAVIRLMIDGDA